MVNELHRHYSYNCLTDEQFNLFIKQYGERLPNGVEMPCPCDDCDTFWLPETPFDTRRCDCGNRRCYLICEQYRDEPYFWVDVS